ncbi:MAG: DUF4998 domain-containing protein [Bacteroidales bacterium]|jgi:hypothetical protein|nr:DUF4998 domain-containing protein [Bacteroidales bacterium]
MNKLTYVLLLALVAGFFSCKKQDDIYKEFLVPNGLTYPQKPTNLLAFPGMEKLRVSWHQAKDPSIEYAIIYWNNYTDSMKVEIPTTGDSIVVDIPLKEETYTLYVKAFDKNGNASIPADVTATPYGESFLMSLLNRSAKTAILDPDTRTLTVEWGSKATNEVRTIVSYIDMSDKTVSFNLPVETESSVITNYKSGFSVQTRFYPKGSIDTLQTVEAFKPTVTAPAFFKDLETTLGSPNQTTFTEETSPGGVFYWKMVVTGTDPYVYTAGLPEPVGSTSEYVKVYFHVEYQNDRAIPNAQIFYCTPNAAGGKSTDEDQNFDYTGLDPDNAATWKTYTLDCATAIKSWSWGASTHRFRYDYVPTHGGSLNGTTVYIRRAWFELWTQQPIQ